MAVVIKFDQALGTFKRLIRRGAVGNLANMANRMHPADLARVFRALEIGEQTHIFGLIKDIQTRADLISEMDEGSRRAVISGVATYEMVQILKRLPSDDVADILGSMSEEQSKEVLTLMGGQESQEAEALLKYPAETAGGIMTTKFFALREDTTVQEAIKRLQQAEDVEMVFYVYVVDKDRKLVGVASLRKLLLVPPPTTLREIMESHVIQVGTGIDQEEVARLVARYDLLALPVVDPEDRLVGIITVDDVIDVIREEATEDILKMAGTKDDEYVFSGSTARIAGFRLPWLLTAVIGSLISGAILWHFRGTLQQVIVLTTFIPLIMAIGGNVGLQSSTIVIRGLATGRIEITNVWRVFRKEAKVALFIGILCGALIGGLSPLWHGNPAIGMVVGISIFSAVVMAAMVGTLVPLFFKWIKVDPAVAAGPFVTTTSDITGNAIYLGLATWMIGYLG
jgi:magnesium transporter